MGSEKSPSGWTTGTSLKDEGKGTGGRDVQVAGCAKALGLERLGVLEEQKGGHMARVLR